ncbi:MAG: hypothetical protein HY237_01140 [Acidobacteria bacterium]|nr:hypothetical protein [Acidobacteriota bacterium]
MLSLGEDALAVSLVWAAFAHPVLTIGVLALVAVSAYVVATLFRFLRNATRRIFGREPAPKHR